MRIFLHFVLLLCPFWLQAQFTYRLDQSIPVQDKDGNTVPMAWAGGINAAQFNTMDLNADGTDDLVLYDRMANKVITFLAENNVYHYAPEYETMFPEELTNWLLLRDYNCDGKKDIFTGDVLGIRVFTNTTQPGAPLSWKHFLFYSGPGSTKSPVVLTKGTTVKSNLQLQYDDLPSISDVDGDGDLDIFNVRFTGNGTIEYHQNFGQERGSCDSLDFERSTSKWAGLTECDCGDFAFNNETCASAGRVKHAAGKSLLALDANGDATIDLLLSEATCTRLYFLPNTGSIAAPVINSFSNFPEVNPVSFLIFPAAYHEDVDFDGIKDLIATPNIYGKTYLNTNLKRSNWFYKNTGTNTQPAFTFSKPDLLQDQMIDVGDNAVPAFADYDNDGDYDMFISQNTSSVTAASIYFYENTGTLAAPAFKLVNDNYMNFTSGEFYNLKIQFAHITADNLPDLVFTATSFQDGVTSLYYLPNQGSGVFQFSLTSLQQLSLELSETENVSMAYVNGDGLPDLLVGRSTGSLEYWRNTGTRGAPSFSLEDDSFLGIASSILRQNVSAEVADLDADGKEDLILGDQTGELRIVDNYHETDNVTNAFLTIAFNPLTEAYEKRNLGGRIWPVAVNLFNTDKPVLAVGTILGGITLLRHDEVEPLPETVVINPYPNPGKRNSTIQISTNRTGYAKIISATGQEIGDWIQLRAHETNPVPLTGLSSGVYIFYCIIEGKTYARRFVIY
jgi:hypothetical protein